MNEDEKNAAIKWCKSEIVKAQETLDGIKNGSRIQRGARPGEPFVDVTDDWRVFNENIIVNMEKLIRAYEELNN